MLLVKAQHEAQTIRLDFGSLLTIRTVKRLTWKLVCRVYLPVLGSEATRYLVELSLGEAQSRELYTCLANQSFLSESCQALWQTQC
jgi:hypothetical protein